ncbi:hypothetical protein V565_122990 [Rhizoctonia solani 123E]|uniref:Uncharacterized protein n=1 Tax=Rhizoctonia solani 123E TaxID=1423351 RepID=A0A074RNQ0_9AGAM|nr:hypothetical protein V565_122990 [Rhizoctonia solani 123E]
MSVSTTPSESNPSIVTRKVGAGIQARLAKLQGAAGTPVVAREPPKKFPNGYDDPFRERLDGTLRRSMSGTWSVAETSITSDGSHTLVDSTSPSPSVQPVPLEDLKRRQVFTQNWEKEQQAVKQLASPEPSRIASSPQPIIELPEPDDEPVPTPTVFKPAPAPTLSKPEPAPEKKDPKHGILTPPISEPEVRVQVPVVKKPEPAAVKPKTPPKRALRQPHASSSTTPAPTKPSSVSTPAQASSSTTLPKVAKPTSSNLLSPRTPVRRPRASAPPSTTLAPSVSQLHLTLSPTRVSKSSSQPPRPHTSMTRRVFSSKVPEKVLPPPVRPRAVSKVYEGPTMSSLAKRREPLGSRGTLSRAVSRASVFTSSGL